MIHQAFTALFGTFAQLIIVLSGMCLMLGGIIRPLRRFALRLFILGVFVAVVGSIGYQWLPPSMKLVE